MRAPEAGLCLTLNSGLIRRRKKKTHMEIINSRVYLQIIALSVHTARRITHSRLVMFWVRSAPYICWVCVTVSWREWGKASIKISFHYGTEYKVEKYPREWNSELVNSCGGVTWCTHLVSGELRKSWVWFCGLERHSVAQITTSLGIFAMGIIFWGRLIPRKDFVSLLVWFRGCTKIITQTTVAHN